MYERVAMELESDPTIQDRLRTHQAGSSSVLDTPAYNTHKLVEEAINNGLPKPLPMGLYLDGVRFTAPLAGRADSAVGFWGINLLTTKRHFIGLVRHLDMCKCGCRGWCSLFPVLAFICWNFEALANGERPSFRHDGTARELGDMMGLAKQFGFTALLFWIKGDWAEWAKTLALQTWASWYRPCPFCDATHDTLHTLYRSMSTNGAAWDKQIDYFDACDQCEIIVNVVNEATRQLILRTGVFKFFRSKSKKGKCLTNPIPELNLKAGDRLVPSLSLFDIGKFNTVRLPVVVTFWRENRKTSPWLSMPC